MFPSRDQIERAAYDRWERRGRCHGADREDWVAAELDVTFALNYRPLVEYSPDGDEPGRIGSGRKPRCRFCEQSPPRARFSKTRSALPEFMGNPWLLTREICDECVAQFSAGIDQDLRRFWDALDGLRRGRSSDREMRAPSSISIPAYKGLIRIALTLMPEAELSAFTDTIEWVGNPDHDFDRSLFGGVGCLLYEVYEPSTRPWASLTTRVDDEAQVPYMLSFLGSGGLVVEAQVPLCSRDEDLDGNDVRILQRSFTTGSGCDQRSADCFALPLNATEPPRPRRFRMFK
jgi:hypothetical protein